MRSDFLHYDIFPISRIHPKSIHPKYTYELLLSVGFELRRITRVRIRYSFLAATRGCKVPTRIRVTQTSAGFSGAGALPACERMNRRRTGVYPLIVNMQGGGKCLCARIYLRRRRRKKEGFCFRTDVCKGYTWRVSRSDVERKYISSFYLISSS